jgi:hypothetical protein
MPARLGSRGGVGGQGSITSAALVAQVTTTGRLADGVLVQSVGRGVAGTAGLSTAGAVLTTGDHALGLPAQSVGGGGGTSGVVITGTTMAALAVNADLGGSALVRLGAASATALDAASVDLSIGGNGGNGGTSTDVRVTAGAAIATVG